MDPFSGLDSVSNARAMPARDAFDDMFGAPAPTTSPPVTQPPAAATPAKSNDLDDFFSSISPSTANPSAPPPVQSQNFSNAPTATPTTARNDLDDFFTSTGSPATTQAAPAPASTTTAAEPVSKGTASVLDMFGPPSGGSNAAGATPSAPNVTNDFSKLLDFYELLAVAQAADDDTIKRSYRKIALKYHPDRNPDQSEEDRRYMTQVTYDVLKDSARRAEYNRLLAEESSGRRPLGWANEHILAVANDFVYDTEDVGRGGGPQAGPKLDEWGTPIA